MGTTLTGTTPQDTYDSLIKVTDNGPLSGTAKYLSDGLGNDSALALSTSRVGINQNNPSTARLEIVESTNAEALRVDGSGSGFAFVVNGGTSYKSAIRNASVGSSYFATAAPSNGLIVEGNVGIGTSSPDTKLEIQSTSSAGASLKLSYDTLPSGTVITNDVLGQVLFEGLDASGGGTVSGVYGRISSIADGLWDGSPNRGADLTFSTAQYNGTSVVLSERLRILSGGGLTFNGDTAAANALDDYEEGTWTPSLSGNTTYSAQAATYTKIGRQVTVHFAVGVTTLGTGSGAVISGLPFTAGNINRGGGGIAYVESPSTAYASINPFVGVSQNTVEFVTSTTSGVYNNASTVFTDGSIISGTVTYFV